MSRCLTSSVAISMTLRALAIPMRAATKPRAGTDSQHEGLGDSAARPDRFRNSNGWFQLVLEDLP
jgi:hypothetical protein